MKKEESYIQKLADYLKNNVKKGYDLETLRWALINQGHSRLQVEKAMSFVKDELAKQAPVLRHEEVNQVQPVNAELQDEKPSFWKRLFG